MGLAWASGTNAKLLIVDHAYDEFYYFRVEGRVFNYTWIKWYKIGPTRYGLVREKMVQIDAIKNKSKNSTRNLYITNEIVGILFRKEESEI